MGGAGVIISTEVDDRVRRHLEDESIVLGSQRTAPRPRAVITPLAPELAWLFNELKAIFSGTIDHISKYDFYGRLAEAANEQLAGNEKKFDLEACQKLLFAVIREARAY